MKTLLINAHPDFANDSHFSNQLQERFLKEYASRFAMSDLTVLNLYDSDIPHIEEGQLWSVWEKQAAGEQLDEAETLAYRRSSVLLEQFKSHHRIVIATPLHNFNVTSRMKDYLDNILIARQTFRYIAQPLENGKASVGLMTDDYRALVLIASGSVYTKHDYYEHMDFAPRYLKAMFADVMGFSDVGLVRAEGTATLESSEILASAESQLGKAFERLYR
ncbi:MAG: NAD(P)H-dependent oxidoreductase [Bifidobacteriaceae bacterium]|jgi:FMN-dependent NADH-azoreductase|nr:NAD(P)H-dependent oxidoreductase [Bifidobacteriaceae bacterium]